MHPNVLVAMNPAALRKELHSLEVGGTIIVNVDTFEERNLTKAGYSVSPLETNELANYTVFEVPMTSITKEVCKDIDGVKPRDAERSKNFFALGLMSWLYQRPLEPTLDWIDKKFAKAPQVIAANTAALRAGHAFGETAEMFALELPGQARHSRPGHLHQHRRATRRCRGVSSLPVSWRSCRCSSAPIPSPRRRTSSTSCPSTRTSASAPSRPRTRSLRSPRRSARRSAATSGITTTSGPGVALKGEAIGLAISLELPLLVIDIQRGGPSTGLPTKTEASDLMMAMYGRHGESPIPIVAAYSPAQCFHAAIEAARIAFKYRTPVMLLSDGYLANGSEPWLLPDVVDPARHLDRVRHRHRTTSTRTATSTSGRTCATPRPWPGPGRCPARPV